MPAANEIKYSVVVPVYGNEGSVESVTRRLEEVALQLDGRLEVVFVIDGSPDRSGLVLEKVLPAATIDSQLVYHSRNFGSFAAIRSGLAVARGEMIGVMAADLQEPPELMLSFFETMATGEFDVVVGRRESRDDPALSSFLSRSFWNLYRRWIEPEIPRGGVDVFGCTRDVARQLLTLGESHSSLVGLLFWVGYRRAEVPYSRSRREQGKSGWTMHRRIRYLLDSVFSFTDLPISALTGIGAGGMALASIVVFVGWWTDRIAVGGYTPLMLTILLSTFSLLYGLGVVGSYVWRTYENSKGRPASIVMSNKVFDRALD
ncbi:glycosyltransferase family 2 protein [Cellulomonas sp. P22]|uniref:glycosyltransferase family 2 protein n=1 Tax=Cellulomonas sp. P22 TaxID=3373189 RepID=UPI0037902653